MSATNNASDEQIAAVGGDWARRKAIVAVSGLGALSMAPVSLLQLGFIRDLPDPPIRGFDSKKVNLSSEAYVLGMRDGPLAFISFALNVPLALAGSPVRLQTHPWLPVVAATKALGEAIGALIFFWKMPTKEKAWCGYCISGAISSVTVLALTLPEARRALKAWTSARRPRSGSAR